MHISAHSLIADKARLIAMIAGGGIGASGVLFRGLIENRPLIIDPAKAHLLVLLLLCAFAGLVAATISKSWLVTQQQAGGIGGRLGIRAGLVCGAVAGALLTLLATRDAEAATLAEVDRVLRARMWLVLAVSLASLLPGVLCGFVGGLIGGRLLAAQMPARSNVAAEPPLPWLRWVSLSTSLLALLAFASPLSMLGKPLVVDPPIVKATPASPTAPPFHYEVPPGIKSARMGEIQPDFVKIIPNVNGACPFTMSPDGVMIAYGDASGSRAAVGVHDLHRFTKIASIAVPALPTSYLVWSPDQKAIACTIGDGSSRRIWILQIAGAVAVELPRPPGRDVPGGELHWWHQHELAFFPNDEPPQSFNLQTLTLAPLEQSPEFQKLDDAGKRRWLDGPRSEWPEQAGWKLALRTVIQSAVPPPRRSPDTPWQLSGKAICALAHPDLPLAFGLPALTVNEGAHIACSPDGSKLAHPVNGGIEILYMKRTHAPGFMLEVTMPFPVEEIDNLGWNHQVTSGSLCVFLCAPLRNPLNGEVVGPDYDRVHGLAQLVEWKGRNAVFVVQTYDGSIQVNDIATTLHYWEAGRMSEWNPSASRSWWSTIRASTMPLPKQLAEVESPSSLELSPQPGSLLVMKTTEKPRRIQQSLPPKVEPKPTPPPVPSPPPPARITQEDVLGFLTEHHAKASRGDVAGMVADYDQFVDFLDKGSRMTRAAIEIEETKNRARWPQSTERITSAMRVNEQGDRWIATYTLEFHNENAQGESVDGKADMEMGLRSDGTRMWISSQKARVHDLKSGSRAAASSPASKQAGPPPVKIRLPGPVWVAVNTHQVNGRTYEVHEAFGWVANRTVIHRTYRNLVNDKTPAAVKAQHPDGVISMQTAEMEGTLQFNGPAQFTTYIGKQGWVQDKDARSGEWTKDFETDAEQMVGKSVTCQMVGDDLEIDGRRLKLVKNRPKK